MSVMRCAGPTHVGCSCYPIAGLSRAYVEYRCPGNRGCRPYDLHQAIFAQCLAARLGLDDANLVPATHNHIHFERALQAHISSSSSTTWLNASPMACSNGS
jgi:hypothetical protein